jgi:GWxTD domain-containing protein
MTTRRLIVGLIGALACAAQDSPYLKWLNEDVVYIIAPGERDAFLRLRDDSERQQFIAQFWQRRDAPREEHYRRIAFTRRFPGGWRSDRGRAYIVNGPPDQIESRAGGEVWRYRKSGMSIEFDAAGKLSK